MDYDLDRRLDPPRAVDGVASKTAAQVRASAQGHTKRTLALPTQTFIERFLLHVLPKGLKRIRHYGLLGPAGKAAKLAQASAMLSVPAPDPVIVESVAAFMDRIDRADWARCPNCGQGAFVPTAAIEPTGIRAPSSRGCRDVAVPNSFAIQRP